MGEHEDEADFRAPDGRWYLQGGRMYLRLLDTPGHVSSRVMSPQETALLERVRELEMEHDPQWDGTNAACDCWLRGNDAGVLQSARLLQQVVEGKDPGGHFASPEAEQVRRDIYALREFGDFHEAMAERMRLLLVQETKRVQELEEQLAQHRRLPLSVMDKGGEE